MLETPLTDRGMAVKNALLIIAVLLVAAGTTARAEEGLWFVPGDANLDGRVDMEDAKVLSAHWGHADVGWSQGDFNGDGRVNASDASILAANVGYVAPSSPPPTSANPEPTTLLIWSVLGILGALSRLVWRRRPA